jgi:hypothetical protein
MTHLDEKTLELYVLGAKEVADQRGGIESHLKECAGCRALRQEISDYYAEVQALQEEVAAANTQALTMRDWIVHARRFEDRPAMRPVKQSLALRAVVLAVRHPVIISMSFLALLAGALLLSYPRKGPTDLNPAYARAKDEFLIAFNKNGEELWRKHAGIGYDFEGYSRNNPGVRLNDFLTAVDIDHDGKKEVIAQFGWIPAPILAKSNAVVCYNSDGSERWKYEFHRQITFGNERFSDEYVVGTTVVGDFGGDGKVEVIAVLGHVPYYPNAILRLDARSGTLLSEYWHPGVISATYWHDSGRKGVDEFLFGGCNNGYDQADLLVLDPRRTQGRSPAPPAYSAAGILAGLEKYYILLPRTDLNRASLVKRSYLKYIRMTSDSLWEMRTHEIQGSGEVPGMLYYFDRNMRCVRVDANDYFVETHHKMEEAGKLAKRLNEQYFEELRQGVRYWNGEKFVKEPTMNKRYAEVVKNLP